MQIKLFGDTQKIDWPALGVSMPFAPMHELAENYQLESNEAIIEQYNVRITKEQVLRTFELQDIDYDQYANLCRRMAYRTNNTITALDQCTPDTICINLGGGYHHAGKYPKDGYAYSLINDIIWAVDYQLGKGDTIGIIDLDFHFGGGTAVYYHQNPKVALCDFHHMCGILMHHTDFAMDIYNGDILAMKQLKPIQQLPTVEKILLNIGTDWYQDDALFGQYGQMLACDLLEAWWNTVRQITIRKIPLCITMGGGYGSAGLPLYEEFISGLRLL